MFQNRWGALFFVGLTLVGAASLVGTEDEDGAIASAAAQLEQQGEDLRARSDTGNSAEEQIVEPTEPKPWPDESFEFASEEDLMIDPTGIDPTPIIEDPAEGEVVIVESSAEIVSE